jgi:hypothetical protein
MNKKGPALCAPALGMRVGLKETEDYLLAMTACAAASRAMGTRNGEQLT